MEELDYSLLFRWFVGLTIDGEVWDATVFSKNRERLIAGEVASGFFAAVRGQLERSMQLQNKVVILSEAKDLCIRLCSSVAQRFSTAIQIQGFPVAPQGASVVS